jgi:hypothetical protein
VLEFITQVLGPAVINTGSTLFDTLLRVFVLYLLIERGHWLFKNLRAKKNGNGKLSRRISDKPGNGNPGNPHGVADLCARHDASIKLMFEKISGVERKFEKELREVRDRVIHLEAKAEKQNERRQ